MIILAITVAVSIMALQNRDYFIKLAYAPFLVHHNKQWYRMLSHVLVHADWAHLGVNMWVLWMFGGTVQEYFANLFGARGTLYFLLLYVGGTLFASLPALRKHKDNAHYTSVGASGAIAAVLFSAIALNPMMPIRFIFLPFFDMPAFVFGLLYLAYEIWADKRAKDNIAHDAHYWGAIFGVVFTLLLAPEIITYYFG